MCYAPSNVGSDLPDACTDGRMLKTYSVYPFDEVFRRPSVYRCLHKYVPHTLSDSNVALLQDLALLQPGHAQDPWLARRHVSQNAWEEANVRWKGMEGNGRELINKCLLACFSG